MIVQLYTYRATVLRIYDADTLTVSADLGFRLTVQLSVRLAGINARELRDPGGREARAHLASLCPIGSVVTLHSLAVDKYGGRTLGRLLLDDGTDVAERMVASGYAARWDGQGPRPVPAWPLPGGAPA